MTSRESLNEAFAELEKARREDDMEAIYTAAIKVTFYSRMIELEKQAEEDGIVWNR